MGRHRRNRNHSHCPHLYDYGDAGVSYGNHQTQAPSGAIRADAEL